MECEERKTGRKYSSGSVELKRVNVQTFVVGLRDTQSHIHCEVIPVDAKIIMKVIVNHAFLPLISE